MKFIDKERRVKEVVKIDEVWYDEDLNKIALSLTELQRWAQTRGLRPWSVDADEPPYRGSI